MKLGKPCNNSSPRGGGSLIRHQSLKPLILACLYEEASRHEQFPDEHPQLAQPPSYNTSRIRTALESDATMSKLHDALSSLRPTSYSNIPIDDLANYLQNAFQQAELILNSVPPPPGGYDLSAAHRTRADPRPATSASEIRNSNVRPPPPDKFHEELQKVWGKPLKLGANDNPLGISVYKMAGHDRRGAWFARRSVHEGLGFERWKRAMQREFPASLAVQKGPGEGSVRGIGGDRVLERKEVEGLGKLEGQDC